MQPIVSFCLPFYGGAGYLASLLESIKKEVSSFREGLPLFVKENFEHVENASKESFLALVSSTFPLFELIIVDDGTEDKEEKRNFSKIIKQYKNEFLKKCSVDVKVVKHSRNLGLVEARRSAILIANGKYLAFLDSDDEVLSNAFLPLVCNAHFFDADIVHGKAEMGFDCLDDKVKRHYSEEKIAELGHRIKKVNLGVLLGENILKNFVLEKEHVGFLWAKLFKTETVRLAFQDIPNCYCVMAEDFLIYFFILLHSKKYIGIENFVYKYFIARGISGNDEILSLAKWEQCCTAGVAFAIIFEYLAEHPLGESIQNALECIASSHLISNLKRLHRVDESIKNNAYIMIEKYWGAEIVIEAIKFLEKED